MKFIVDDQGSKLLLTPFATTLIIELKLVLLTGGFRDVSICRVNSENSLDYELGSFFICSMALIFCIILALFVCFFGGGKTD